MTTSVSNSLTNKVSAEQLIVVEQYYSATVWNAIEEGKSIFYNIQNFLRFQLSTSMAALTLIAAATLLGLPNPLNAMQILWISEYNNILLWSVPTHWDAATDIMCDGPVAQTLGVEAVDPEVMKAPPRPKNDPIITRKLIGRVAMSAILIVLGTLFFYAGEIHDGHVTARGTTIVGVRCVRLRSFLTILPSPISRPLRALSSLTCSIVLHVVQKSARCLKWACFPIRCTISPSPCHWQDNCW